MDGYALKYEDVQRHPQMTPSVRSDRRPPRRVYFEEETRERQGHPNHDGSSYSERADTLFLLKKQKRKMDPF